MIVVTALAAAASGCGEPESAAVKKDAAPAHVLFDPAVQPTVKEFVRRLKQYDGGLLGLSLTAGTLSARWRSAKCDHFEPEVIDLLISVNRTIKESPTIAAERECGGTTRTFRIPAKRFQQYRTGQINDSQILADTK